MAQVKPQVRSQNFRTDVDLFVESGFGLIEIQTHIYVLRSLAREHERDRVLLGLLEAVIDSLRVVRLQRAHRLLSILTNDQLSVTERLATLAESVRHVSQVEIRMTSQVLGETGGGRLERGGGLCG